jgi:hypothetical protein
MNNFLSIFLKVPEGVLEAELCGDSWTNMDRKCHRLTACHTADKIKVKNLITYTHAIEPIVYQKDEILEERISEKDKKNLMENTTLPKGYKFFLNSDLARYSNNCCGAWQNYFNGGVTIETFTPDGERMNITRNNGDNMYVEEYYGDYLSVINKFKGKQYFGKQTTYYSCSNQINVIEDYSETGEIIEKVMYYKNGNYKSRENGRFCVYYNENGEPTKIIKKQTVYLFENGRLKDISVFGDKKKDFYKRMKLKVARGKMETKILALIA